MAPYPSYTLTIADGVSPVTIGRPKRYRLCLHCVIFVFVHAAYVAPFSLSFPERICFPSIVSTQCGSIERARIKHAAAVRAADSTAGCMYVWPHPVNFGKKKGRSVFLLLYSPRLSSLSPHNKKTFKQKQGKAKMHTHHGTLRQRVEENSQEVELTVETFRSSSHESSL